MKNLLFLCGPNGIGKTTISKEIVVSLPGSAYVDSDPCRYMNPFVLNDETIPTIAKNITDLIMNFMNCPTVQNVVFSYGFHGRRKEIFDIVMKNMAQINHNFIPFLLWCSIDENIKRMNMDNRSAERIQVSLMKSRSAYDDVIYPKIDITDLSVPEASRHIMEEAGL